MKKPRVVMLNAVSLDGSFIGFEVDMKLFMDLTSDYRSVMILEGSQSLVTGLTEMCKGTIPPEEDDDFVKLNKKPEDPYFVVPDSKGISQGLLHMSRRMSRLMGMSTDVILLVTEKTSRKFIDYLEKRHFDYHVCGKDKVDFIKAFDLLSKKYGVDTIRIDAGPTLTGILLKQGLVDEIVLQMYPVIVGKNSDKLLSHLTDSAKGVKLELIECRESEKDTLFLHYRIVQEESIPLSY
jgi:2,5-diamino-6-(ribosylamino)-4(3H)-pyrimidinone 5'-phosphate reductase